jgi:hypothetical protein
VLREVLTDRANTLRHEGSIDESGCFIDPTHGEHKQPMDSAEPAIVNQEKSTPTRGIRFTITSAARATACAWRIGNHHKIADQYAVL